MEQEKMNREDDSNLSPISPYSKTDIRTLWWDFAVLIGENPEKFVQDGIKAQAQNKKFNAKQHWIDTFGTKPPKDFGYEVKEV